MRDDFATRLLRYGCNAPPPPCRIFMQSRAALQNVCCGARSAVIYGPLGLRSGFMTASIESGLPRPNELMRDEEGEKQTAVSFATSVDRRSPICLVVEDDSTLRHLVTNYLEDHDIRAISASRRDEVSGLLARSEPDLVVLDLKLGQEDGLDLLREIR